LFIKWVNHTNPFIRFYQSEEKNNSNFSINPIAMHYEKLKIDIQN